MMYEPDNNSVGVTRIVNDHGDDNDNDSDENDPTQYVRKHHPIRYVTACVAVVSLIVMSIGIEMGMSKNKSPPMVRGGPGLLSLEDWETACALRSTQTDSGLLMCLDQCHQFVCCDYGDCDERGASEWIKENCDLFELWCPEDDNDDYYYDDDGDGDGDGAPATSPMPIVEDGLSQNGDSLQEPNEPTAYPTNDGPTITPFPTYIDPTLTPYPTTTLYPTVTPYPTVTAQPTYLLPTLSPYPSSADDYDDDYDRMQEKLEKILDSEFSPTLTPYPTITPEPTADEPTITPYPTYLYPTLTPFPTYIVADDEDDEE
jgi:hypothetical protein